MVRLFLGTGDRQLKGRKELRNMPEDGMRRVITSDNGEILLNPGMGYMLIQRGRHEKQFDELAQNE